MKTLQINLMGEPEIYFDGQLLKFPARKVLALFIYLVVEGGLHRREKLVTLFWPESEAKSAKAALRTTLARLRRALQVANTPIISETDTVGFDFASAYRLDLDFISEALKNGRPDAQRRAIARYRGDFLTAFSLGDTPDFDDWVSIHREAWRQRLDTIFDQLSQHQLDSGEVLAALTTVQRWLEHDRLHETTYRRLMQLQSMAGNRSAALEAFEMCQQILADELGVEPAPETIELAQRIRDLELETVRTNRQSKIARPQSLELPLSGRASAFSQLTAVYRHIPQVVRVEGEAGIGKTRLITEFLNWAEVQGADVLKGRAFELGGRLTYQPLIDALRERLEAENAPDDLLDDVWLAELSHILPELRERYPDLPAYTTEESLAQSRLFESVARLGEALSQRQPLIFFIDDVQWLDEASRDLLHYLGRRWQANKAAILLVLTLRSEVLSVEPQLQSWLNGLERDTTVQPVSLTVLTQEDTGQLVERLADQTSDHPSTAAFAAWLFQETEGNPFFIDETLKSLQEAEILQVDEAGAVDVAHAMQYITQEGQVPIPATVRKAILTRLERLDPNHTTLLTAGAVIGRNCSFELLSAVSGVDELAALDALDTLLQRRLLVEQQDKQRPYLVAHDKIRDVVYTEAGEARRRLYHRRALAILEAGQGSAAELAHHAQAAQLPGPAFRYALAAGHEALALHAAANAVSHYAQAFSLLDQVESTSAQRCALCTRYGRALEVTGAFAAAIDHYHAMEQLAQQIGDSALQLAALLAEGILRATPQAFSDFALAETLSQAALDLARTLKDTASEAKVQWNLGNVYRWTDRIALAVAAGKQSLALAEAAGLREQMAYACNDLAFAYMETGDVSQMLAISEQAMALWREVGDRTMYVDSVATYGGGQAFIGNYAEALSLANEALEISRALDNRWGQAFNLYIYAYVYLQKMDIGAAIAPAQESVRLAREIDFIAGQIFMGSILTQLYLAIGVTNQAETWAAPALTLAKEHLPLLTPIATGSLALVKMATGDMEAAGQLLNSITLRPENPGLMQYFIPERAMGYHALQQKDFPTLLTICQKMLTLAEEQGLTIFMPDFYYLQAQALVELGRPAEARTILHQALVTMRPINHRWGFWKIAGLLADLEGQSDNEAAATDLRQEVRTSLDYIIKHIPEGELRMSFVAVPEVRRFLDKAE